MKIKFWIPGLILLLLTSACSKESVVPEEKLPASIKEYVDKHFPGIAILQVTKDRDGFSVSYELMLEGSVKLDFDRKNHIKDIESVTKLPDTVIPAKILAYVSERYPDNFVKSWELDDNRQEIELDNGLDLVFSTNGDFLRIDS